MIFQEAANSFTYNENQNSVLALRFMNLAMLKIRFTKVGAIHMRLAVLPYQFNQQVPEHWIRPTKQFTQFKPTDDSSYN